MALEDKYRAADDDVEGALRLISSPDDALPHNLFFDTKDEAKAKQKIGGLIARFLYDRKRDMPILLGSGSTVLHVGLQMCEVVSQRKDKEPYKQNIWTINVPLAAQWLRAPVLPAKEVHLPEAALDLQMMRFRDMKFPNWTFSIVVLGVHGCLYDQKTGKARLYAGWEPTQRHIQGFIDNVKHILICCLPSGKLEDDNEGCAGAHIDPPPATLSIGRFLVTDKLPKDKKKITSLEKNDQWIIVTEDKDWKKWDMLRSDVTQEPSDGPDGGEGNGAELPQAEPELHGG